MSVDEALSGYSTSFNRFVRFAKTASRDGYPFDRYMPHPCINTAPTREGELGSAAGECGLGRGPGSGVPPDASPLEAR